jgi:hypothetical protein
MVRYLAPPKGLLTGFRIIDIYQRRLCMKATALLCLLFTISALSAVPMAGTYVIGGESCDFFTLQGAIDTLETLGAGDDVTFELSPGTYEGPFVLNQGANGHQLVISSGFNTASEWCSRTRTPPAPRTTSSTSTERTTCTLTT